MVLSEIFAIECIHQKMPAHTYLDKVSDELGPNKTGLFVLGFSPSLKAGPGGLAGLNI